MLNLVKLKPNDNIQIAYKIDDYITPKRIFLPAVESFKEKEYVYKNSVIGDYTTSISGFIKGVKKVQVNGKLINALEIENDFEENIKNKLRKHKINNKEELIKVLDLVNLKDLSKKINSISKINNLVVCSIDEEEYNWQEFLNLTYNYSEILDTTNELIRIFNLEKSILATKSTNFKSIQNVKSIIGTYPNILVSLVPSKYLISYPPFLCEYLNLEVDTTLVLTTNEINYIYQALNYKSVFETKITISGNAINESKALNVKLYTSFQEVLQEYFEINDSDYEIYMNGLLGGVKLDKQKEIIITRETTSFIINKPEKNIETECINCGACQKICPMKINVKKCFFAQRSHKKCINCGLCDYICPAKIRLKNIVGGNYEKL